MSKFSVDINKEFCKGCGLCVNSCKFGVLSLEDEVNEHGYFSARVEFPEKCTGCASCYLICPDASVTISEKE